MRVLRHLVSASSPGLAELNRETSAARGLLLAGSGRSAPGDLGVKPDIEALQYVVIGTAFRTGTRPDAAAIQASSIPSPHPVLSERSGPCRRAGAPSRAAASFRRSR